MFNFFIDRPIFAWVLAILVMVSGVIAVKQLPIAMYPDIAPPTIAIYATYPGASAKTVEDTVTQVIEQQMNGIDHLEYLSSASDGSGLATITLTFAQGTDADIAQVQVQNKLQLAQPLLPPEVQQQGLKVAKANKNFLMILTVSSRDGSMDSLDLSNFVASSLQDSISRVNGVGQITLLGSQYAMRIWLQPEQLHAFSLTPIDVIEAVRAQNVQIAAGQLGGTPSVRQQRLNATILAQSRLQTPAEFGNILLRVNADGSQVRLRDVATIELGGESFDVIAATDSPATALGISLTAGANALETGRAVKEKLEQLKPYFPHGVEVGSAFDTTPFIQISIEEVIKTLAEAMLLVFAVMFLFLQNLRATLIPAIAVPVVLLGTFGVMAVEGFSINILTLFGLVLAIGLLVDDAIVVVENVERVMSEEGLSPRAATRKAMGQISGALVGVALVLVAVFVPMAFLSGSTGVIYRQFTLTMVTAMTLSVLVAMVLTPALCATLLQPAAPGEQRGTRGFFAWFNRNFDRGNKRYQGIVRTLLAHPKPVFLAYAAIIAVVALLFVRLPTAFLPDEDQGYFINLITLPVGSTLEQTTAVLDKLRAHYLNEEKDSVRSVIYVAGNNSMVRGQNVGLMWTLLKPWEERTEKSQQIPALIGRSMQFIGTIKEANIFAVNPSSVPELGNSTGFDLQLQDRGGIGHDALMAARDQLLDLARAQTGELAQVRAAGLDDTPMYQLDIDPEKASALGLDLTDIYDTLGAALGSAYVNDFIDRGRVKKVYVMGAADSRMQPDDLRKWHVRNREGAMVPFTAFTRGHWTHGSPKRERYNGVPSVEIQGAAAAGKSSGQAMETMERLVAQLPAGIGYEWTGLSFEEKRSGAQAPLLYALSVLVVFLCLAALYESWSIPFSVILVVPLGVLGALIAATLFGLSNDVYFQVGLLTTVGLAAKNAILVVEFAKEQVEHGRNLADAAMSAVALRLRPILMTSLAFLFGVLPLAISSGAGAASRNAIGIGVAGGLLAATFLVILFVPVFFVVVLSRFGKPKSADTLREETRNARPAG
jgi:multidrug efflux pump